MIEDNDATSSPGVAAFDARVRLFIYRHFVDQGRAPSLTEVAERFELATHHITASFERLADGKALVLQPESGEVLMAEPFSAVPTAFDVEVEGRRWWGNCIWDALGILAMFDRDGRVVTSCGFSNDALELEVEGGHLLPATGVVHYSVPVKKWWENVVFA